MDRRLYSCSQSHVWWGRAVGLQGEGWRGMGIARAMSTRLAQCHKLTPCCKCMTPRHSREGQPDLRVVCVVFVTSYISLCPEEAPHLRTCHPCDLCPGC